MVSSTNQIVTPNKYLQTTDRSVVFAKFGEPHVGCGINIHSHDRKEVKS